MSGSKRAGEAVMSRRDAIIGALALAAGSLLAIPPETASALNGATITVGGLFMGSGATTIWKSSDGTIGGDSYSGAGFNTLAASGAQYGVEGYLFAHAPAASAGVRGWGYAVGQYGVLADHQSPGGTALRVNGAASFSRSGKGYISKNHSSATVSVPSGVGTASLILVTLQGSAGSGRYVTYAKRSGTTSFRVYLNKAAAGKVYFAWFIIS